MKRQLVRVAVRVALFSVVCLAFVFVLVTVFGQFRFESRDHFKAVFTNVSGLKGGNFVRIAGVEVGKVSNLKLNKNGTVTVSFEIDKGLALTDGTKAAVRYENLIGDRYLSLEDGPGTTRKLRRGATIPLARTSPALDVDALIGGFRPLFRALDPDQVNALSGQLLRVFQGQGATVSSVLAQTSALTSTLAGRDKLIGDVITNLNIVLRTFAVHDDEFSEGLVTLSQLVQTLSERRTDIAKGVAYINSAAASIADLLTVARQPIHETVVQTDRFAGQVEADHDYFDDVVKTLPQAYQVLARNGLYGDYFGFYLCDAILKVNGQGGQPVFIKLVSQVSGRCKPKND
jgi:phospholipid/cholesterol/gamma-HCH transport system substrate-binding protein